MARIRSIKPEFPHSESMGRVSRDARLTFILLWTLSDDEGRLRGNSRMLASLLYPYDDDAKKLIDGWLAELETEKCVIRYQVEDANYVQISNWLMHQKIDKPSRSKIPGLDEASRIIANVLEVSSTDQGLDQGLDQGSRIKDWKGSEQRAEKARDARGARVPDPFELTDDLVAWAASNTPNVDVKAATAEFVDYWRAVPGGKGRKLDWVSTWRNRMREVQARNALRKPNGRAPAIPLKLMTADEAEAIERARGETHAEH